MEHNISVTRRARYYSSGSLDTAATLWVVIHGYGQLAGEFVQGFGALVSPRCAVVAPEALNRYYKDKGEAGSHATTPVGTTWMTREYRDGEIADYVEYLDAVVQAERRPGVRLGVLAFSQGVATATRWVACGNTQFDQVVMWAGQMAHDVDLAAARHRFPAGGIDLVLGTRDEFGEWIAVDRQAQRLSEAGIASRVLTFGGGHRLDDDTLRALAAR